jgi:hypothetical protein
VHHELKGWNAQRGAAEMSQYGRDLDRADKGSHSTGSELNRKFWVALALYGVLAVLAWFTVGEGTILVYGKPVELRLLPLIIIGGMVLKTVLARQAEKIRRGGE